MRCWSQVEQPSLPGGADGGTADGGDEGWALRVAQLWMPELLRFGWLCVMLLQKTALEGPRSAQLWRFPSLAPNSPQLAPGRRGPAVTTATGPAEEAGPGRSFALLRAPRSWRPSPPTALSLEAASGASGSYSVSGSPVSAPASHQVGVLGLMASFTPLRVAGPSQGSTETLAPGSARSSPFEEQRRRVKEDGKVNAPALRRAARGRGAAAGGAQRAGHAPATPASGAGPRGRFGVGIILTLCKERGWKPTMHTPPCSAPQNTPPGPPVRTNGGVG